MRSIGACVTISLLVLSVLTGCTAASSADKPDVIVPGLPGEPARTLPADKASAAQQKPAFNEADVRYVTMMIAHHQQAIEMTALVPTRAARDEVKAIASRIADTQGPDIKAMQAWLTKVKAPAHEMRDPMPGMASPDQLAALRAANGPDFDTMFLRLMTTHHEGAITMAADLLQTGSDVFVEEMAQDVLATQQKEISQMKAMLG
ncbi:DUF305 domain-containing protein [Actinocrispum wychmicini]|uniref:DUF305 domain-containing protein n=1 Tax=Actinocrispum wychmicini TaxID=1213861 RepID=UPI001A9F2D92|nr:DUF305 domain-containing protein [Actinocrispum wychmicini]